MNFTSFTLCKYINQASGEKGLITLKQFLRHFSAMVLCSAIVILSGCSVGRNSEPDELNFQHSAQDREVGITQSLITYEDDYAYGIHYPSIGVEAVDAAIKSCAQKIADDFIAQLGSYEAHKDDDRAILTADYKTFLTKYKDENHFAGVVFEIKTDIPGNDFHSEKILTMFFDLRSGQQLDTSNVFKRGFEVLLSEKVREYFGSNRLFSAMTDTENFKKYTAPEAANFSSFTFSGDNLIIYFDAGTAFDAEKGCVEAVIPVKSVKSAVSADILKALSLIDKTGAASSESAVPTSSGGTHAAIPSGAKYIAFTFDDGPHQVITNRILDLLEKTNSRATFFVLGTRVGSYADTVKRAYSLGCEIGNHSYSHANLRKANAEDRRYEVNRTNKLIREITGETPTLFRVPYGDFKGIEADIGMPLIQWCIDTEDWKYKDQKGSGRSAAQRELDKQKIVSAVLDNATGGEIVLMHDLYEMTAEAFEEIVPELIKRGFVLVTVSELYEIYGIELEPGKVYRTPKSK